MNALKKFWHWLRMEDENGKPLDDKKWIFGLNDFRYSEGIKHSPLKENMTPDDIFMISHKRADGVWVSSYITFKQLKDAIVNS